MATFTLEDLKADVAKKYEATVLVSGDDEYVLPNLLQLTSAKRTKVMELIDKIGEGDEDSGLEDQLNIFKEVIIAAEQNDKGEELLELFEDNSAMLFEFVESWMENAQVGEPEPSSE